MRINRRTFQTTLLLAIGGASLASLRTANAAPATVTYRHRLRLQVKGSQVAFWLRVAGPGTATDDVPFTLTVSSDPDGNNVVRRITHVAHAASSHIVRGSFNLNGTSWKPGAPLFGSVAFAGGKVATKTRQMKALQAGTPA